MGIEHSNLQASQSQAQMTGAIRKQIVRQDSVQRTDESGRSSPHPSISSEPDVPYVSYTVNRPIGESPKHQAKQGGKLYSKGPTYAPSKPVKGRNIVVVSQKSMPDSGDEDSEILTLQRIPLFLPIIRSSLSTTHPREPDIVDRLDSAALQRMVALLEDYLKQNSEGVASEQNQLVQRTKEVDHQISSIMAALAERQKAYARYTEKLARIHEVAHSVSRCQLALATALDSIETLNRQLPANDRLEDLVLWSTG